MYPKHQGKLFGERLRAELDDSLRLNETMRDAMLISLEYLPNLLRSVRQTDLADQLAQMTASRNALNKAIALAGGTIEQVDTVEEQLRELRTMVKANKAIYELRNIASLIHNEYLFFEGDVSTVEAVLDVVGLDTLAAALSRLSESRRQAIATVVKQAT